MSKRLLTISKILVDAGDAVKRVTLVPKEQRKRHLLKLSSLLTKLAKELSK